MASVKRFPIAVKSGAFFIFILKTTVAYNELLSDKIEQILNEKKIHYSTKRMFGGLCYMVDQKMCIGIVKEEMMARINPNIYESSLKEEGINKMNFTGRPMKGYIFIQPQIWDQDDKLEYWIQKCLDFNPLAKASKKKKK